MISVKKTLSTAAIALLMATGALVASGVTASARMACNSTGDCWHTDSNEAYPGTGYSYHPDDWHFHQNWATDKDYHYRDYHEGRGYYKGGLWVTL